MPLLFCRPFYSQLVSFDINGNIRINCLFQFAPWAFYRNEIITATGNRYSCRNIDQLISKAIGVPAYVSDDALFCVAKGTGIALENLESYKRSILGQK